MAMFGRARRRAEEEAAAKATALEAEDASTGRGDEDEADTAPDRSKSAPIDRIENGPFDINEHAPVKRYVDLGALRVPARQGLGIRLEMQQQTGQPVSVLLQLDESVVQVQAFASPRSTGLWNEVRETLREQLDGQGVEAIELASELGVDLIAQLPIMQADGEAKLSPVRFVGVDGPRWFLRGVIQGRAMEDDASAARIEELFRSIVVVRGDTPMPPRELLPLRVPADGSDSGIERVGESA